MLNHNFCGCSLAERSCKLFYPLHPTKSFSSEKSFTYLMACIAKRIFDELLPFYRRYTLCKRKTTKTKSKTWSRVYRLIFSFCLSLVWETLKRILVWGQLSAFPQRRIVNRFKFWRPNFTSYGLLKFLQLSPGQGG